MTHPLVGQSYIFEDGSKIEVIEVKRVDPAFGSERVFYLIQTGAGIPRKLVMSMDEFMSNYSHLFKDVRK
jgi:hypothetical protein